MASNSRFDKDPKRSRSFTLSAFRKSAAREPQPPVSRVAAAAPQRKAMPWQWGRRAEPAAVAGADRRPSVAPSAQSAGANRGAGSAECQPKPPHSTSDACRPSPDAGAGRPPATPPSTGPPTPLYDEVELYGLTSQMADFLHRLQTKQADQQKSAAATDQSAVRRSRPPPLTDEAVTIRRSISSCAALGFSYGFRGPISALHKLLRKVLPGHHPTTKARPAANVTARSVPVPIPGGDEDAQYHYHHYIHHHHFHYHYDPAANPSLDEASFAPRSRRHSESSDIRGRIPALIYEESADEEEHDEENKSPLSAFLARRRRNSDSAYAERHNAMKATQSEVKRAAVEGPADHEERKRFSRRYNSERYPSKANAGGNMDEELWKSGEFKARRRHSTEIWREDVARRVGYRAIKAMEEAARVARGGGMAAAEEDGLYNLSGAKGEAASVARRRSASFVESYRRAEGVAHGGGSSEDGGTPSPARRRWGQELPALRGHQSVYSLS